MASCIYNVIHNVLRALRYSNVKMKKRFEPDYGSGATGFPEEDTDIGISARRLSPEEQDLLLKIWQLKREIRVSVYVLNILTSMLGNLF